MRALDIRTHEELVQFFKKSGRKIKFRKYNPKTITPREIFIRMFAYKEQTYNSRNNVQCLKGKLRSLDDYIMACKTMIQNPDLKLESPVEYIKVIGAYMERDNGNLELMQNDLYYDISPDDLNMGKIDQIIEFRESVDLNRNSLYFKLGQLRWCPDIRRVNFSHGYLQLEKENDSYRRGRSVEYAERTAFTRIASSYYETWTPNIEDSVYTYLGLTERSDNL